MENKNNKGGMFDPKPRSASEVPKPKQIAYETAAAMAWEELAAMNLAERAEAAGAHLSKDGASVIVNILGNEITLTPSSKSAVSSSGQPIQPWEIIIVLHYLVKASGKIPTGKPISYKEIPDGLLYWPNFVKRSVNPIIKTFSESPEKLMAIVEKIGGTRGEGADVCAVLNALPRVPITIQLWRGDSEFPPEAAILFDSTVTDYLPTEDVTVLSQMMAIKLMMIARQKS